MNEKFKKYWWIIVIILLIGGVFYWYEWRPAKIRAYCEKYVFENKQWETSNTEREQLGWDMNKINAAEREKSNYYYEVCIHKKGINQ
jgi:hypothetical protein